MKPRTPHLPGTLLPFFIIHGAMKNGALLIVVAGALVHFNANIVISPLVVVSGVIIVGTGGFLNLI